MAFRIHDSVVRGEIDNRVKGIVHGKIWIEDRAEPMVLELTGNAWPDLAGSLLTFINPLPRIVDQQLNSLNAVQRGSIGDLTASRKVRTIPPTMSRRDKMTAARRDSARVAPTRRRRVKLTRTRPQATRVKARGNDAVASP